MEIKKLTIYFFRKDEESLPSDSEEYIYTQISIPAYTLTQAKYLLKDLVKNDSDFYFNHLKTIEYDENDFFDDDENN